MNPLEILKQKFGAKDKDFKFDTFGGVFTPNILTILGVIAFLRLGWVVGNAGLLGALAIILLAHIVTVCTAMSMSALATNTRIGHGGTYAMISRALGLEVGGAVGIPLYLSITLGAAFYFIGFAEGWASIFPGHNTRLVASAACLVMLIISYISAQLAVKVQYLILAAITVSLFSLAWGRPLEGGVEMVLLGPFSHAGFWATFAIFFPAVTGIQAGINMSGELKDPSRSIPIGGMASVLTGLAVYLALAVLLSSMASPTVLREDYMALGRIAPYSQLILMGIFAATLSSALTSMVGAPRVLASMADDGVVPFSRFFGLRTRTLQPRNAVLFSAVLVEIVILLGSLDAVASLLTMFFLITYASINLVVFVEETIGITSFRPKFRVHRFIPLAGFLVAIFFMLVINVPATFLALIIIGSLYWFLVRKGLDSQQTDVRWGLFWAVSAWAARQAVRMPKPCITWKPDFLIPIEEPNRWSGTMSFISDMVRPGGSVTAFNVAAAEERERKEIELAELLHPLAESKQFTSHMVVSAPEFVGGAVTVIEAIGGTFFRPNVLFLTIGGNEARDAELKRVIAAAKDEGLAIALLRPHPKQGFGHKANVNVWLRDKTPNWNLALLLALRISANWDGKLNLLTSVSDPDEVAHAQEFLDSLAHQARMPANTRRQAITTPFPGELGEIPPGDITIFGLAEDFELSQLRKIADKVDTACMFVRDSGGECIFT